MRLMLAVALGTVCLLGGCRTHDPTQAQSPQERDVPFSDSPATGGSGLEGQTAPEHVDQGVPGNKL